MNKVDLITAEREVIESKFQLMIDNFEIKTSKRKLLYCRTLLLLPCHIDAIDLSYPLTHSGLMLA